VQEHCGEDILDEACLFKFGWYIGKVIAMYIEYNRYEKKGCYIEENRKCKETILVSLRYSGRVRII